MEFPFSRLGDADGGLGGEASFFSAEVRSGVLVESFAESFGDSDQAK